jgi:hypothetical protein
MEAGRIRAGKVIEEELKALSIQERQFQKEALSRQWFDRPVQVETLEAVGRGDERLDPAGRDTAAYDGQQAAATFVLRPQPPLPIAVLLGAGYVRLEVRAERGLELGDGLRLFFGCERRGVLGLAFNRYRTSRCTVL